MTNVCLSNNDKNCPISHLYSRSEASEGDQTTARALPAQALPLPRRPRQPALRLPPHAHHLRARHLQHDHGAAVPRGRHSVRPARRRLRRGRQRRADESADQIQVQAQRLEE